MKIFTNILEILFFVTKSTETAIVYYKYDILNTTYAIIILQIQYK